MDSFYWLVFSAVFTSFVVLVVISIYLAVRNEKLYQTVNDLKDDVHELQTRMQCNNAEHMGLHRKEPDLE